MDIKLTKDADYMICTLYASYKQKRKNGASKADAKNFINSHTIHSELIQEWSFEDVDDTCRELGRAQLLNCRYGDDVAYFVHLNDNAIIYMENRFTDGLTQVLDYVAKIKKALLF